MWSFDYMMKHGSTSGHRWYLLMVLQARVFLQICEKLRIPNWAQVALISMPGVIGAGSVSHVGDACALKDTSNFTKFILTWVFGTNGGQCAAWVRWVHSYVMIYVICFHYLRPLVERFAKRLPKGPAWAASATAASMLMGTLMALYHYPNNILETGDDATWAWLELTVSLLQPMLFALGTTYWPVNLAWWGNTTLGCYVIHFYIRDRMTDMMEKLVPLLAWEPTGLMLPIAAITLCVMFTSTIGPLGHYLLVAPQLLCPIQFTKRMWHQSSARKDTRQ
jgi:hypothetical protein